eukprot:6202430-Pleurochrysis_carterae.AAC.2
MSYTQQQGVSDTQHSQESSSFTILMLSMCMSMIILVVSCAEAQYSLITKCNYLFRACTRTKKAVKRDNSLEVKVGFNGPVPPSGETGWCARAAFRRKPCCPGHALLHAVAACCIRALG